VIECIVTLDIFIKFSFFLFGFLLFFFFVFTKREKTQSHLFRIIVFFLFVLFPVCHPGGAPFFSGSTTATATTEKRMGHWVCLWITTKVVSLVDDGEKLVRRYRVAVGVPLLAGQRCSRKLT
jgi:hypothetical protein